MGNIWQGGKQVRSKDHWKYPRPKPGTSGGIGVMKAKMIRKHRQDQNAHMSGEVTVRQMTPEEKAKYGKGSK